MRHLTEAQYEARRAYHQHVGAARVRRQVALVVIVVVCIVGALLRIAEAQGLL